MQASAVYVRHESSIRRFSSTRRCCTAVACTGSFLLYGRHHQLVLHAGCAWLRQLVRCAITEAGEYPAPGMPCCPCTCMPGASSIELTACCLLLPGGGGTRASLGLLDSSLARSLCMLRQSAFRPSTAVGLSQCYLHRLGTSKIGEPVREVCTSLLICALP